MNKLSIKRETILCLTSAQASRVNGGTQLAPAVINAYSGVDPQTNPAPCVASRFAFQSLIAPPIVSDWNCKS